MAETADVTKHQRSEAETKPMSRFDRLMLKFRGSDRSPSRQMYIPPKENATSFFMILMQIIRSPFHYGFRDLVIWRINTGYSSFFLQSLIFYFAYINIFTAFIYLIITALYANEGIQCAHSTDAWIYDETSRGDFRHNMEIAFEISWITFSTVGYGNVSPSGYNSGCYGLRYFCAFEAFFGLVFFGLLGAVFFAKIGKTFSEAPITFSSTLCLQFDTSSNKCPVLEIQIVNNKANYKDWEILDASLSCMVAIDVPTEAGTSSKEVKIGGAESEIFALDFNKGGQVLDASVAKQTYHKIELTGGGTHPYFNRIWHCRHVLDENSPLLQESIKEEIKNAGGNWPSDKRSHHGIRAALVSFNTMIANFQGMSGMHLNQVFAEKRYTFEDVYIGWEFAGLLFLKESQRSKEKKVMVDMTLVHDIVPQHGESSEPFDASKSKRSNRSGSVRV